MTPPIDRRQVRRAFSRAAPRYGQHARLQREVEDRLLERLEYYTGAPRRVLDVGCGPGRAAAALRRRYRQAQVIALDLAPPMLRRVRRGWLRPIGCVCADAQALPLAEASVDVLFSSLCVQWIDDLPGLFAEFRRVLASGGYLALSTLGPDTLYELRAAWAEVDPAPHVGQFADIARVGDALLAAGFRDPVLDTEHYVLHYADALELMRDLQAIGATNADAGRGRGLMGKQRLRGAIAAYERFRRDGLLPATYEVITAHAFGPEPNQPRRTATGEIASFPLERLRGSRR